MSTELPPVPPNEGDKPTGRVVRHTKEFFQGLKDENEKQVFEGTAEIPESFRRRNLLVEKVEQQRNAGKREKFSDKEVVELVTIRKQYQRSHQLRRFPSAAEAAPLPPMGLDVDTFGEQTRAMERYDAEFIALDLRSGDFTKAILSRGCLVGSDFSHAQLEHAILIDADCRGCDFTNANLGSAIVDNANFTGAILTGATLPKNFYNVAKYTKPDAQPVEAPGSEQV